MRPELPLPIPVAKEKLRETAAEKFARVGREKVIAQAALEALEEKEKKEGRKQ